MTIRAIFSTSVLFGFAALSLHAQTLGNIADWTFETPPGSFGTSSTTFTWGAADSGSALTSSASGHHSSASTFSSPAGNGSSHSFSSNNWSNNDYYQIQVSTVGYTDIKLQYDQFGSSTGPKNYELLVSTDGTTFTLYSGAGATYNVVSAPAWSSSSTQTGDTYTFDLSGLSAASNDSTLTFRIEDTSTTSIGNGTVGLGGTDRIDNVLVSGTALSAVPEPSTYALIFGGAALGMAVIQRRRQAKAAV